MFMSFLPIEFRQKMMESSEQALKGSKPEPSCSEASRPPSSLKSSPTQTKTVQTKPDFRCLQEPWIQEQLRFYVTIVF